MCDFRFVPLNNFLQNEVKYFLSCPQISFVPCKIFTNLKKNIFRFVPLQNEVKYHCLYRSTKYPLLMQRSKFMMSMFTCQMVPQGVKVLKH